MRPSTSPPSPAGDLELVSAAQAFAPVLVVAGSAEGQSVLGLLEAFQVEVRCAEKPGWDEVAFALRRSAVVLIAGCSDPVSMAKELRAAGIDFRIGVLCERMGERTREELLSLGVKHCLRLPVSRGELARELTRLTLLKRECPSTGFTLDPLLHTVSHAGKRARLSPHEFALLQCLMEHASRPVAAHVLKAIGWGPEMPRKSKEQILTVAICRLRRKLKPLGAPYQLVTVRNTGYALSQPSRERPDVPETAAL